MPPRKKKTDDKAATPSPKKPRRKAPDAGAPDTSVAVTEAVADESAPAEQAIPVEFGSDVERIVVFHLGDQRYALTIESVQEIQQIVAFSEVPAGYEAVVGMINLRGEVIPAVDMRMLVGLPRIEHDVNTPMVICRSGDQLVAMVVDEVEDVITLPEGCMVPPPRLHVLADRLIGVCRLDDGLVFLLDASKIVEPIELPEGRPSADG